MKKINLSNKEQAQIIKLLTGRVEVLRYRIKSSAIAKDHPARIVYKDEKVNERNRKATVKKINDMGSEVTTLESIIKKL